MEGLKSLLYSRKFWIAIVAVVQTVVFAYVPEFPTEVWVAIDGLAMVLINAIAREDAAEKSAISAHRVTKRRPNA